MRPYNRNAIGFPDGNILYRFFQLTIIN